MMRNDTEMRGNKPMLTSKLAQFVKYLSSIIHRFCHKDKTKTGNSFDETVKMRGNIPIC